MAILFAAATAVPAWSRLGGAANGLGKEQLAPAVVFFAGLCWINCVGIEKWEAGGPSRRASTLTHYPLGQPASASHRNHDCAIFAGRGPAGALTAG